MTAPATASERTLARIAVHDRFGLRSLRQSGFLGLIAGTRSNYLVSGLLPDPDVIELVRQHIGRVESQQRLPQSHALGHRSRNIGWFVESKLLRRRR